MHQLSIDRFELPRDPSCRETFSYVLRTFRSHGTQSARFGYQPEQYVYNIGRRDTVQYDCTALIPV